MHKNCHWNISEMSAKEESQKLEQEKKRKLEEIFVLQQDLEKLDEEILRYKRMRTLMILDEAKLWTFVETADLLKLMNVVTLIADGKVCEKDVIPRLKGNFMNFKVAR